jgi:hypothetical protein
MGWRGERNRHALSARGIETGNKCFSGSMQYTNGKLNMVNYYVASGIKTNGYSEEKAPRCLFITMNDLSDKLAKENINTIKSLELHVNEDNKTPCIEYIGNNKQEIATVNKEIINWGIKHGYRIESAEEEIHRGRKSHIWWIRI